MEKKLIFNELGKDDKELRQLIGGNSTNLFNLNNVKYDWAIALYRKMLEQFWIPEKVSLTKDVTDYNNLTEYEQKAYKGILSFLIFLDSIQTINVPRISDYITAPEVSLALAVHQFYEALHSQSYQYIIETVIPFSERNSIYDYWREDDYLLNRNKYIASIYQNFSSTPNTDTFSKVLVANYILESIYFYNGFNFFYTLASRHLMQGTADVIRYINKDELTHIVLFQRIIQELNIDKNLIYELVQVAVTNEIEWTNHIIGNNVLGINEKSTEDYTKNLANRRLISLGLKPLYEGFNSNPYKHLERIADVEDKASVKSNFFESTVTSYQQSTSIPDGDW